MSVSSIYHFFARIALRRGYFATVDTLGDFYFPQDMVFTGSSGRFPDFVLKTNDNDVGFKLAGGEIIEMKDAKSYSISSFNSTIPSETKRIDELAENLKKIMINAGEIPESLPVRQAYYLIRGRNLKAEPAPKTKICLVSGKFFETIPLSNLLPAAFGEVARDASDDQIDIPENYLKLFRNQADFASSRAIEGASVKIRFRVMAEAHPDANILNSGIYPMIRDDTLSILLPEEALHDVKSDENPYPWIDCPEFIRKSPSFAHLNLAFNDIDSNLKRDVIVSKLQHPLNGPFLLAQFDL